MSAALPAADGVDVLLFEAAGFRMGADAGAILKVTKRGPDEPALPGFGRVKPGSRAIVARAPRGDTRTVAVDAILGVRRVGRLDLRPLPPFLRGLIHPAVIGFAVIEEALVALVELSEVNA